MKHWDQIRSCKPLNSLKEDSKSELRNVKSYFGQKNLNFPNSNELLSARKFLKPNISIEMNGNGVSVDYKHLIEMTTVSLINSVKMDDLLTIDP